MSPGSQAVTEVWSVGGSAGVPILSLELEHEGTVLAWSPGDQIPLGRRTLQVVRIRHDAAEELPVLVVSDLA